MAVRTLKYIDDNDPALPTPVAAGLVPTGGIGVTIGDHASGKHTLIHALTLTAAQEDKTVIWITAEDSGRLIHDRLEGLKIVFTAKQLANIQILDIEDRANHPTHHVIYNDLDISRVALKEAAREASLKSAADTAVAGAAARIQKAGNDAKAALLTANPGANAAAQKKANDDAAAAETQAVRDEARAKETNIVAAQAAYDAKEFDLIVLGNVEEYIVRWNQGGRSHRFAGLHVANELRQRYHCAVEVLALPEEGNKMKEHVSIIRRVWSLSSDDRDMPSSIRLQKNHLKSSDSTFTMDATHGILMKERDLTVVQPKVVTVFSYGKGTRNKAHVVEADLQGFKNSKLN